MKKWMKISLWILSITGLIITMSFVRKSQQDRLLEYPDILIEVEGENAFLTEQELEERLRRENLIYPDQRFSQLDINAVETYIQNMNEVKTTKVFTEIGSKWNIRLELRKPIARIFNRTGETFYLDHEGNTMLPSSLHTARVMVVNGVIPDKLNGPTTTDIIGNKELESKYQLDDIFYLASAISEDPFLEALVAQVHLNEEGDFIIIPQVGGHTINFGSAKNLEEVERKFQKLKIFYKEGMPYEGWRKYDEVVLKFKDQIVCTKKPAW
jgi:cell division protein FtsQ